MSKEVVVVSLDWSLAATGLLRPTFLAVRSADFLPQDATANRKHRMLEMIADGVAGRKRSEVRRLVAKRAANHFVKYLNPRAVSDLRLLVEEDHDLVALSSAPDFAVSFALRRVRQATGLRFAGARTSRFEVESGHYTGEYDTLDKLYDVDSMLASREKPEAKIGFVNGKSDNEWASRLCETTAMFDSGNALHEAITAKRQSNF